jgi:hypothetical protein
MGSEFRVAFQPCLRATSTAAMTSDSPRLTRATARSKPTEQACHISHYWKKVRLCHGGGTCFLPESAALRVTAPISLSDVRVPVHCHYCKNEGGTRYGREYALAPELSRLCTPLHHSFRLQHGAAWTSMVGAGGTTDAPSETWGTAGNRFTLKHILLLALCSLMF